MEILGRPLEREVEHAAILFWLGLIFPQSLPESCTSGAKVISQPPPDVMTLRRDGRDFLNHGNHRRLTKGVIKP